VRSLLIYMMDVSLNVKTKRAIIITNARIIDPLVITAWNTVFAPMLTGYSKEGNIAWCSTKDSTLSLHEREHGEYVQIDEVSPQLSLW